MPLHLLGKKSWNVYNQDNIARVRQDEAAARLAEQEAESTQQQEDARQRLRLLRGEQEDTRAIQKENATAVDVRDRKRKRGLDDGNEQLPSGGNRDLERSRTQSVPEKLSRDSDFGGESSPFFGSNRNSVRKASTGPGEDLNNLSNMKFKDAVGRHAESRGPWYAQSSTRENVEPGKDVWGNEDPGRKARNEQRINADDPLLAMKKGVRQLRESEKHRKEWMEQRDRDLYEVEELARRHKRHKGKHHKEKHRSKHRRERRYS